MSKWPKKAAAWMLAVVMLFSMLGTTAMAAETAELPEQNDALTEVVAEEQSEAGTEVSAKTDVKDLAEAGASTEASTEAGASAEVETETETEKIPATTTENVAGGGDSGTLLGADGTEAADDATGESAGDKEAADGADATDETDATEEVAEEVEATESTGEVEPEESEKGDEGAVNMVTVYVWMDGYAEPVPVEMPEDEAPPEALGIDAASTRRRAPARANLPSYEEAYAAMIALMSEYPEGMTWTNYEPYGDNGKLGKYYRFQGGMIHGAYAVGVGCAALCFKFHDLTYPGLPTYVYDRGSFDWDDIHVGDFLRVDSGTHSVTVLKKTDNAIIVVEGNYNGGVHWGRVISKADLMREITYMVTSYPKGYTDPSDDVEVIVDHRGTEGSLSWELNSNGVLTITGSGAMPDYDLNDTRPGWYDYRDQIYSVEIGEGVTSIGDNAFRGLETAYTNLNSVTISTTVTSIGAYAFYKTGLVGVAFPGGVKTIGANAFYVCPNLTSIDFGGGVETIGDSAFYGCTSLKFVDIPSNVRSVGSGVFAQCKALLQVRFMANDNITIGDDLLNSCWYLNFVSLPNGITSVPAGTFYGCKSLAYLYLPGTVTSFGEYGVVGKNDPFGSMGGVGVIYFGGTEAQWTKLVNSVPAGLVGTKGVLNSVTATGQVCYEQDDPFVPAVDDPGDEVTCAMLGEHIGDEDENGNCDVCGEPYNQTPGSTVDPPIDPNPPVDPPVDPVDPPAKHEHSWASDWTTNESHHWHECLASDCPATDSQKDGYAEHACGDWKVVTEPGIDSAGLRERICECGYKQTEEIPATGYIPGGSHDHDNPAEDWTYGSDYHWHACLEDGCQELYDYAAHTWAAIDGVNPDENGWVIITPATASTPGERTRTCEVCGYTATEEIPATGGNTGNPSNPGDSGDTNKPSNPGDSGSTNKPSNPGGSSNTNRPGSGGGSTTTKPTDKPTTTVTTDPKTGVKTETTVRPDGTKTVATTQKDGTVTTVETMVNGAVKTEVRLSKDAMKAAAERREAVQLPVEAVRVVRNIPDAMPITVRTDSTEKVSVVIPVAATTPGTVAMLVGTDGSTNVVKTSVVTADGVVASLPDGATVVIVDNSKVFTDVASGNWAANAVAFASARGLFDGTSTTTFLPNATMTRGMLMTVLARLADANTAGGETWYTKGVEWAIQNGISDGSNPNGEITREQLVVMLWRYYGSPTASGSLAGFTDAGQVSGYAQEAMAWAVENGIVSGFGDGRIGPQGQATRAQVAQMLMNLLNNLSLAR